jgi:hypothetical protein
MDSSADWSEISDQMTREAEYQGSLLDCLKEIRTQINEAFDVLADEDLTEDLKEAAYNALDIADEEIGFAIQELSRTD